MKKYTLKILYPSSNENFSNKNQFEVFQIYADKLVVNNYSYEFYDDNNLVAMYPINFTIIEEVINEG